MDTENAATIAFKRNRNVTLQSPPPPDAADVDAAHRRLIAAMLRWEIRQAQLRGEAL